MNKEQYMRILAEQLRSLSLAERNELLYEYEAHFAFGIQSGKTEEEICSELGNPYEIVQEVLQERNEQHRSHSRDNNYNYRQEPISQKYKKQSSSSAISKVFLSIAFGFLTIIVFPFGISMWAIWFSLSAASIAFILSPLLCFADFMMYSEFVPAKWFAAVGLFGLGLVLAPNIKSVFKGLLRMTAGYCKWMAGVVRGGKSS
ncbi:DUF1700 domain-containing protein [Paenibacillus albiflavus]|nr:DUF1700 domain-containing protein [Paenibacillus albiflavus]